MRPLIATSMNSLHVLKSIIDYLFLLATCFLGSGQSRQQPFEF